MLGKIVKLTTRETNLAESPVFVESRRASLPSNFEVAIAVAFIFILLLVVSVLGYSIQRSVTDRSQSLAWQQQQVQTVLSLKNRVTESMFPSHDYLITGDKIEKQKLAKTAAGANVLFDQLQNSRQVQAEHFINLDLARQNYNKLLKIEREITAIPNPTGNKHGAELMIQMDGYQGSVLVNLEKFIKEEKSRLNNKQYLAQASERRAFIIIQGLTVFMVFVVLVIGYIGRKNAW